MNMDSGSYKDRVILITGAGSGIGKALAENLAHEGAIVYATDIDRQAVENVAAGARGTIVPLVLDVRDPEQFQKHADRIVKDCGRMDYLFNNAGIGLSGNAHELPLKFWNNILDINLRGAVNGITIIYPIMVRQGSGHIVNVASLAGFVPIGLLTPYSMTKHGLVGLSNALRIEARAFGVKVSAICPAAIETPLLDTPRPAELGETFWLPDIRRYLTKLAGAPYPVDKMVAEALKGILQNKREIVIPARARMVWRLNRLFPGLVEKISITEAAKERAS